MKLFLICLLCTLTMASFSQSVYTPEKGSKDRKEILDIFREDFGKEKSSILFKVDHFLISNNWACAYVTPFKNNIECAEPRWNLFNRTGGKWSAVDWSRGMEIQDDFELVDLPTQKGRIANLIVKKYPGCPMAIFGK